MFVTIPTNHIIMVTFILFWGVYILSLYLIIFSAYNPKCNGNVENVNRRIFVSKFQRFLKMLNVNLTVLKLQIFNSF